MKPTKHKYTILHQVCNHIPVGLVPKLAKKHKITKKSRSFSVWSHVVAMIQCHLARSISLNDIVDTLRNQCGSLATIRNATPPSRNGLSHANRERDAAFAEDLFWAVYAHLKKKCPKFGYKHGHAGIPHRFKRTIHAMDSTTIKLFVNCISWAKHRRRKAAAKCHMLLDMQTLLPKQAIVKTAGTHDSTEAAELCAGLKDGEIALFDKAYLDYRFLFNLNERGIFWVSRAKSNLDYKSMGQHSSPNGDIIRDEYIQLSQKKTFDKYPKQLRLVEASVEVNGKLRDMTFTTNNMEWASSSICDLYKCRWGIETFFKEIKQTLQLKDFVGHNENAVKWQIWMGLLTYLLLRFIAYKEKWDKSFTRLFTLVRGVLFSRLNLSSVMAFCGTARGSPRITKAVQQLQLKLFDDY